MPHPPHNSDASERHGRIILELAEAVVEFGAELIVHVLESLLDLF
jgi:hypothetical protein